MGEEMYEIICSNRVGIGMEEIDRMGGRIDIEWKELKNIGKKVCSGIDDEKNDRYVGEFGGYEKVEGIG